jgi:hypothetical protein
MTSLNIFLTIQNYFDQNETNSLVKNLAFFLSSLKDFLSGLGFVNLVGIKPAF